jgi:hypothetical protein
MLFFVNVTQNNSELAKTFCFPVPPLFCNIVYNLSNFVFYTELNARLPIYSHDH